MTNKGEISTSISTYELFFKNKVFLFLKEARSFEVTRRGGKGNVFVPILFSMLTFCKQFVEAKMNIRQ